MADSNSDKQIQELLLIQLGLQQKSDTLFKDLLKSGQFDPLDDIYKSITSKNQ